MKLSILTTAALSLSHVQAACNADNCARAVTGTFRGFNSAHGADCASFQLCTFPTPTITAFDFSEVAVTTTITAPLSDPPWAFPLEARAEQEKRTLPGCAVSPTVCPSQVPAYASACQGSSRYESACSCAGYTKVYTIPDPVVTSVTFTQTLEVIEFVLTDGTSTTVTDVTLPLLGRIGIPITGC